MNTSDNVIRRIKYFFYWFQIQKPQAVKNLLKRPQLWLLWWQKKRKGDRKQDCRLDLMPLRPLLVLSDGIKNQSNK